MALRPQHVAPELLNKVTKALGITALDQWYYVSQEAVIKAVGTRVFNKLGGTSGFLKAAYPQHHFDEAKLSTKTNQEKDQKFIEVIVRKLFPNTEIRTKARKAVGIINPETEAYLEIDFWIPSLKLGIEYQDKHHYGYQWYANDTLENYQKRDDIKKSTMAKMGYTLITIGYWWDKSIESIAATIRKERPDLLLEFDGVDAEPIPSDPPLDSITESAVIPGFTGIMSPFVPTNNFNPTNWYAGEKHDGIRGMYNPTLHKIFSRKGNELSVLPALLKDIPNMLVEGEIVAGRGNYAKTAAMSYHTHYDKVNWPMFRYIIFDIPDTELGNYTQRYSVITTELFRHPSVFSQSAFRVLLNNKAHLKALLDSIINDSGEGVIAQQDAQYEYGRASGLAKIKVRRDADAQVVRINELSCTCRLVNGDTTDIMFSNDFDPSNLKPGDIISYYHHGYSKNGQPRRGELYKVRYDISWEELVSEKTQQPKRRSVKDTIGSKSLVPQTTVRNKMGHWNKASNGRAFFDEFARAAGFDPLVAENWYPIKYSTLQQAGGAGLLYANSFNLKKALSRAYPELKLDAEKFKPRVKKGHWSKASNVRAFFDDVAKTAGFDPLVSSNWNAVGTRAVQQVRGSGLLKHYSVVKALKIAYPELSFEAKEKPRARKNFPKGYWHKTRNVRTFFDGFARGAGFDPLVHSNWYSITNRNLRDAGARGLLSAYSNSFKKALSLAYPELKFEANNFRTTREIARAKGYWKKSTNVRTFFNDFARTSRFDPLVAENWYPVRATAVRNAGGVGLLGSFAESLPKALSFAYPELNLEEGQFTTTRDKRKPRNKLGHWNNSQNVRAFLDEFARKNGFDPLVPENWYPVTTRELRKAGGAGLLCNHKFSIHRALSRAYPDLQFVTDNFRTCAKKGHWHKAANVRAFFEAFAKEAEFDSLKPENWYPVTFIELRKAGGGGLLGAHDTLKKALSFAYPEMKFKAETLRTSPKAQHKLTSRKRRVKNHKQALI